MLSQKALREFKEIWKKKYSQDLSDSEALEKATKLIELFKAVYRAIPKEVNHGKGN